MFQHSCVVRSWASGARAAFAALLVPLGAVAAGQGLELEGHRAHVVERTPTAISLGDIDGDGDVDAVVGSLEASQLSVLRNNGDGNFALRELVTSLQPTIGVALGDIDGDGDLDAVSCGGSIFRVFRNSGSGTGTFVLLSTHTMASGARSPALVDLEGDGDLDLALVSYGPAFHAVRFFFNSGTGVFGQAVVTDFVTGLPREMAPADLDGDGDVDFAVADDQPGQVRFLMNQGGGVFAVAGTAIPAGSRSGAIRCSDFDQDGDVDVAVATFVGTFGGDVTLIPNLGGGVFGSPVVMPLDSASADLVFADLDGDGWKDIAASCATTNSISWLRNLGSGAFAAQVSFPCGGAGPGPLASADMDGDADADLVTINRIGSTAIVLSNRGDAEFAQPWVMSTGGPQSQARAADMDGDGDLDFAVANPNNGTLQFVTNQGGGAFVTSTPFSGIGYYELQFADIDADLDLDLVTTTYAGNQVVVHRNLGSGTFGTAEILAAPGFPGGLDVGDVDADGDVDVVYTASSIHSWRLARNQGNGTFVLDPSSWPTGSEAWSIALSDLDGDGDLDTAVSASLGVSVYRNSGTGTYTAAGGHSVPLGTTGLCDADVDTDGDVDLIVGSWDADAIHLLVNDGAGVFGAPVPLPAGHWPRNVAAADLDLDGDADLLAVSSSNCVAAIENLGGLQFAPLVLRPVGQSPSSVVTADVDGDGDEDVVTSAQNALSLVRNAAVSGSALCAGDGSAGACPCGNASPPGSRDGCLNSLGLAGSLRASGSASLADDRLELRGAGMPNSSALYFQGTLAVNGGAGSVFGDGLRCAGGSVVRLGTKLNAANASRYPGPGDPSVSVRGAVTAPGTRVVQVWYRNAASFCTADTFNLTNGCLITWRP